MTARNPTGVCFRGGLGAILLLLSGPGLLRAHEDNRGEVHPRIAIENGCFVVTASDNTHPKYDEVRAVIRTLDSRGRLQSTKVEIRPKPKGFSQYTVPELSEEESGVECLWKAGTIVVPDYQRKHGGRPKGAFVRERTITKLPLAWSVGNVLEVRNALVMNDELYLLVTREMGPHLPGVELWLHRFSLADFAEKSSIRLPDPCTIYSFPVCSKIISHEGNLYVAIVRERTYGFDLVLAKVKGDLCSLSLKTVTRKIDWNTHVDLDHFGAEALIVYHYPGRIGNRLPFLPARPAEVQMIPVRLD
jgi:hypothetical protein